MELKNAVEAWKKAKPLLVTKTGISEVLRELGKDPSVVEDFQKQAILFDKVKKALEGGLGNKQLAKQPKALACIKEILEALKKQAAANNTLRGQVNACYNVIFTAGHEFLKQPSTQIFQKIEQGNKAFNQAVKQFRPEKVEFFQAPTRIELLAKTVLMEKTKIESGKAKGKLEDTGEYKEMSEYLKRFPLLKV